LAATPKPPKFCHFSTQSTATLTKIRNLHHLCPIHPKLTRCRESSSSNGLLFRGRKSSP
jgi:hypothetical protein